MRKTTMAALATAAAACSCVAHAQSSVTIYGILDTGVETARASNGVHSVVMMQTAHVPSRLGFRGVEDLGGGLRAGFVLEMGLGVDSGSILQGGRGFGRSSYVSIGSAAWGDLLFGQQLSVMQNIAFYDPDHFSPYSPALAMQLSNLEQTAQSNMITYQSPVFSGVSARVSYALGENAATAPNPGAPQVVGAGTMKNSREAIVDYRGGGLSGALAYQDGGQHLNTGGDATQRLAALAALYDFGQWELGGVYWTERNALPNGRVPTTKLWTLGAVWKITPAVRLVAQAGRATDNGRVYATGATKANGRNNYLNFGAEYSFSRNTHVYFRVGRVDDENNGFNGRATLASTPLREAAPLPVNGWSRGAMVGFRHRF
jgi:predicted porin